jgi:hypothetical protein
MRHSVIENRHATGKLAVPPNRYPDVMAKTTSFVVLAAAMIVNFVLWWAILSSAAWVGDTATSVVVAAVRHGPAALH